MGGKFYFGMVLVLIIVVLIAYGGRQHKTVIFDKISVYTPESATKDVYNNIFSMDLTSWHINGNVCKTLDKFTKATLKTPFGDTPIFVYEYEKDPWVSGALIKTGLSDPAKVAIALEFLKTDNNVNFIDIGANIGGYTLTAAKMGKKVLAIEALNQNVQHLCASIIAGGLQDKVILINNAISNIRGFVNLGIDKNNMGGTFVDVDSSHIKKLKGGRAKGTYGSIYAVKIDDILKNPAMKYFSKVMMKMDIEGFEAKALQGASLFFEKVEVVGILMEWQFHINQTSAEAIINFMTKHRFIPHSVDKKRNKLDTTRSSTWGWDVLWLPQR